MDVHGLIVAASEQPTLVWIACAAIATGMSLVVAGIGLQRRRPPARRTTPAARTAPVQAAQAYQAAGAAPPAPVVARPLTEDTSLALLLARLQRAGDRLEALAGDLAAEADDADDSALKPAESAVEYVFKACAP